MDADFKCGEKTSVFQNTRLRVDGQYDSKTLRVDADFLKHVGKNLRFRKYPAACGRGLRLIVLSIFITSSSKVVKSVRDIL